MTVVVRRAAASNDAVIGSGIAPWRGELDPPPLDASPKLVFQRVKSVGSLPGVLSLGSGVMPLRQAT